MTAREFTDAEAAIMERFDRAPDALAEHEPCVDCQHYVDRAEAAERELAALTAAVRELADRWQSTLDEVLEDHPSAVITERDVAAVNTCLHELRTVLDAADTTALDRHDARVRAEALRSAARDWPIGVCAHRCFREDAHVAPRECLYGPDWMNNRADAQTSEAHHG